MRGSHRLLAGIAAAAAAVAIVGQLGLSEVTTLRPALAPDNDADLDPVTQVAALSTWEAANGIQAVRTVSRMRRIGPGDTLAEILDEAGLKTPEANAAVAALKRVYNPRRDLDVGDELLLTFEGGGAEDEARLSRILFPVAYDRSVAVTRRGPGFEAKEIEHAVERRMVRVNGEIKDSLYQAAQAAGLPQQTLAQLIRMFSYDVDFQRDLQPGDRFELMFERAFDEGGRAVHSGEVHFAALTLSGRTSAVYRYVDPRGDVDYYNEKGESVRKALLRTPVDGARLSSGFGRRLHPVLGYNAMHAGVDFAAQTGTPILAAGDGTVEEVGPKGSYGNYVRIRHNATYDTAYAHVSRFARGMKAGMRVRQGDVIAYVGSTGRATGPHLHFEVHRGDQPVNPMGVTFPSGRQLAGAELARFLARRDGLQQQFAALGTTVVAAAAADCRADRSSPAPRC